MIPGLAAHLLFMCVRHADYLNDGNKLKSLMNGIIAAIKEVITVRSSACWTVWGCLVFLENLQGLSYIQESVKTLVLDVFDRCGLTDVYLIMVTFSF